MADSQVSSHIRKMFQALPLTMIGGCRIREKKKNYNIKKKK
jgi:hypothetical protein